MPSPSRCQVHQFPKLDGNAFFLDVGVGAAFGLEAGLEGCEGAVFTVDEEDLLGAVFEALPKIDELGAAGVGAQGVQHVDLGDTETVKPTLDEARKNLQTAAAYFGTSRPLDTAQRGQ